LQLLFADQLGPHFVAEDNLMLPEVLSQFSKRPYHRQKAHLILFAIRSRALDPAVRLVPLDSFRDLKQYLGDGVKVVHPTSRPLLDLAKSLGADILPARGFASSIEEFAAFASGKKTTRLEDFYRQQRMRHNILMEGASPAGGKWNFDEANRLPPPKSGLRIRGPWLPQENEIDEQVRRDLDALEAGGVRFLGSDGPRKFAATREEAVAALDHFINQRLDLFGPYEDAVDQNDWAMSHSLLSVPMNLGLLDPLEVVRAAEQAFQDGHARLESVEGFIRQIIGWRDYVWQLYWHFGEGYEGFNQLDADVTPPNELLNLDPGGFEAACLSHTMTNLNQNGWLHHIERLMILGNISLQRGWNPSIMNQWFIDAFVDGTPWVMPANVIGMSLYADGGKMSTKPYAAGGAYINRMTNLCGGCKFDPKIRVGENACPVTAGYWAFLERNREKLAGNFRMRNAYAGLARLSDRDELVIQERERISL
jgi:deoxyribodipyrimidine photolyase-related protein